MVEGYIFSPLQSLTEFADLSTTEDILFDSTRIGLRLGEGLSPLLTEDPEAEDWLLRERPVLFENNSTTDLFRYERFYLD